MSRIEKFPVCECRTAQCWNSSTLLSLEKDGEYRTKSSPFEKKKAIRTETMFQNTSADGTEQEAMSGNGQDVTPSGP